MDNSTGRLGEDYIAHTLEHKGYQLLERNFRTRLGEVDIIASDDTYILFVEVKTRAQDSLTRPAEHVTPAKRRKIIAAAQWYLVQHPTKLQPRFDVAEVYTANGCVVKTAMIENAF